MQTNSKLILLCLLVAVLAFLGYWRLRPQDQHLRASGTLEARNINVGSKVGGRITQVLVHEGDTVTPGQLLVTFDTAELSAKVTQSRGRLAQAQATLDKLVHGSRPEEIAEAQAAASTRNNRGFRAEELAQSRAELERAKIDAANAERAYRRAQQLFAQHYVTTQFRDDAEAKWRAAVAQAQSLQHAIDAAAARLQAAKAVTERTQRGSRAEDIAAAKADVLRAQGELEEAEARLAEHEIRSPSHAVVEAMDLRPGDLLPPNAIAARLLEADQLFLIVYVPETQIGQVRLGQTAEIKVDTYPNEVFTGRVEQIRQQAEFLPRNVQTFEERIHQVIGVKLRVENPQLKLRAGVHAEVVFQAITT